jgi:hypothetical protein
MEQDMRELSSPHFDKTHYEQQFKLLAAAVREAQDRIDYSSAHNPETMRAIDVVETFLRKKHRLCYGGQAINAHLPKKYKIYNPERTVPDYDFFTPDQVGDIRLLTKELRGAGFTEISAREGMHEGTIKIYVNYVPVADVTQIDSKLYTLLSQREYKLDGISYLDSNTLRMLMYLEISRPRGEVDRWEKVYERLLLLNEFAPVRPCKRSEGRLPRGLFADAEVKAVLDYAVRENRLFAGADLVGIYKTALRKGKVPHANWLVRTKMPLYLYTPDLKGDTTHFKYELEHISGHKVQTTHIRAMGGDLIPEMTVFSRNNTPFLILMNQSACHSYYTVPLRFGQQLRIATLDTLITLYFSLALLKYRFMSLGSLECLAQELVQISYKARGKPDAFPFPFISLSCAGHQTGLPSLIRAKVRRIETSKKRIANAMGTNEEEVTGSSSVHPAASMRRSLHRRTVRRNRWI